MGQHVGPLSTVLEPMNIPLIMTTTTNIISLLTINLKLMKDQSPYTIFNYLKFLCAYFFLFQDVTLIFSLSFIFSFLHLCLVYRVFHYTQTQISPYSCILYFISLWLAVYVFNKSRFRAGSVYPFVDGGFLEASMKHGCS